MIDLSTIKVPAHIENPGAYRAAVARKIAERQAQARRERAAEKRTVWLSDPENMKLLAALATEANKPRGNPFLVQMLHAVNEWGCLTDRQATAARAAFARDQEREKERLASRAAAAATSRHVGTVGMRGTFRLKLIRRFGFEGFYGYCHGHIFEDADGNELDYLGSVCLEMDEGDTRFVKGTIKDHGERDGVAQTKLSRAVLIPEDDRPSEDDFLAGRFSSAASKKAIKL